MLSNNQQNTLKTSGAQADVSARVLNADSAEQTRKSDRDRKILLLVLLIMFLVITQVIVFLTASGLDQVSEPVTINHPEVTQEDIRAVNDDLKAAMKSLDETEPEEVVEVKKAVVAEQKKAKVEVKAPEKKHVFIPPIVESENKLVVLAPVTMVVQEEVSPNIVVTKVLEMRSGYVKHDDEGELLADDKEQWTCVSDIATDLMWEVKSKNDSMRNKNNLYSWFNPDNKALKGVVDGGRCKGGSDCDTDSYVNEMNQKNYCGHNDWRLPTRDEMMGLVSYAESKGKAKIDTSYFPESLPSWYWTASSNKSRPEFAWYVLFKNGVPLNDLKENPKHIRLVRSGSSS